MPGNLEKETFSVKLVFVSWSRLEWVGMKGV